MKVEHSSHPSPLQPWNTAPAGREAAPALSITATSDFLQFSAANKAQRGPYRAQDSVDSKCKSPVREKSSADKKTAAKGLSIQSTPVSFVREGRSTLA